MSTILKIFTAAVVLWLVFIAPLSSVLALVSGLPFHTWWPVSLLLLPLPVLLLFSVFRSKSSRYRWWVFQYLGVNGICFSAAVCGVLLSYFLEDAMAGQTAVVLFIIFYTIALFAAHRIHVVPLKITSEKISRAQRIVQISDVHIGSRQAAFLEKVIGMVNEQQPDMLLITGDLIDENVPADSLHCLGDLGYPVFYCSGNHERYVDYQKALDDIAAQGVTILGDRSILCSDLHIMGIADRQHLEHASEALTTLCGSSTPTDESFRILLYHQPDLWASAIHHGIDLMLSGHTHKGQIWPFGWLVRARYKHVAGHFQSALSHLFVSQGTGTWGPVLRFGTRCEMTLIELSPSPP